jgi:hypothetical protein
VIPHRAPPGVPPYLLEPADRHALAESDATDWARACREGAMRAIEHPDARLLREVGLSAAALRPGRNLGERSISDDTGREVLTELSNRQRRGG